MSCRSVLWLRESREQAKTESSWRRQNAEMEGMSKCLYRVEGGKRKGESRHPFVFAPFPVFYPGQNCWNDRRVPCPPRMGCKLLSSLSEGSIAVHIQLLWAPHLYLHIGYHRLTSPFIHYAETAGSAYPCAHYQWRQGTSSQLLRHGRGQGKGPGEIFSPLAYNILESVWSDSHLHFSSLIRVGCQSTFLAVTS